MPPTEFETRIDDMERRDIGDRQGVIVRIHFFIIGTSGDFSALIAREYVCEPPSEPFIPANELTPEIVKGWLPASLVTSAQEAVQAEIDQQAALAAANHTTGLPWVEEH